MTRRTVGLWPLLIAFPLAVFADCRELGQELSEAAREGELDTLMRAVERIQVDPACPDEFRPRAGRVAALGIVRAVQARVDSGQRLADQEPLLRRALGYARTWQGLALLGDLEQDRRRYADATILYQEALGVIDDRVATPLAPPQGLIRSVFRKAAESRLLADRYVPVPVNHRSGVAQGLALPAVRGWQVEAVPIPVTFHTGTTRFTDQGEAAVRDLLSYLEQQDPAVVTIVGHADERGDRAYNLALSIGRAEAVAGWLRRQGFAGRVLTRGRGEDQPIELDDPQRYSQQQIWQLNRRVELRRD